MTNTSGYSTTGSSAGPLCISGGGGFTRRFSKPRVMRDFRGGESIQKIADRLGYSRNYILRILRRDILARYPEFGLATWAGGRRLSNDETVLRALLNYE